MPRLITAAYLAAAATAQYPQAGKLDSVEAGADKTTLKSVEAAGFRPFSALGEMKFVKAVELFFVRIGEHVNIGDIVEIAEDDATRLINAGRAVVATDAEVKAAQNSAKAAK